MLLCGPESNYKIINNHNLENMLINDMLIFNYAS